ncbi:MAG TPA: hypothetical protein VMR54_07030 [Thermoanaerobaculia bacterium]|nr:hypothetical protein [Thermoanaerobaculia bacterium]
MIAAWLLALTVAAPYGRLEAEMRRAGSSAGGMIGATALPLETGERSCLERSERG